MDDPTCYAQNCPNKQGGKICHGEKGCEYQKSLCEALNSGMNERIERENKLREKFRLEDEERQKRIHKQNKEYYERNRLEMEREYQEREAERKRQENVQAILIEDLD